MWQGLQCSVIFLPGVIWALWGIIARYDLEFTRYEAVTGVTIWVLMKKGQSRKIGPSG